MKINIQSPSVHASEKLIDFTEDKIGKLVGYSDRIMHANVVLKTDRSSTRDNKVCEITLAIPGNDLFASKQCHTFEEAIMEAVDALKHQVISWKGKSVLRLKEYD